MENDTQKRRCYGDDVALCFGDDCFTLPQSWSSLYRCCIPHSPLLIIIIIDLPVFDRKVSVALRWKDFNSLEFLLSYLLAGRMTAYSTDALSIKIGLSGLDYKSLA